jgi:hypothetical protein
LPHLAVSTSVLFSDADSLGKVQSPAAKFSASTRESPQNATFRIAVGSAGLVRYCFLENSSGDVALDEQARAHLLQSRFSARRTGPGQLRWTVATIEWGNDVTAPPPAATTETAP